MARRKLFMWSVTLSRKGLGMEATKPWGEAATQGGQGRLPGTYVYTADGELLVNRVGGIFNPVYRFGVRQADFYEL